MTWVSDDTMARLSALPELPDFAGTRYRLLGELDRGGMGVVYSADDLTLGARSRSRCCGTASGAAARRTVSRASRRSWPGSSIPESCPSTTPAPCPTAAPST